MQLVKVATCCSTSFRDDASGMSSYLQISHTGFRANLCNQDLLEHDPDAALPVSHLQLLLPLKHLRHADCANVQL